MTNRPIDPTKPDNSQPELAESSAKASTPEGDPRLRRKNNPAWGNSLRMAETEEQWRELINHLPDNARLIWRALNDMKQFWGVARVWRAMHTRTAQCAQGQNASAAQNPWPAMPAQTHGDLWRHKPLCAPLHGAYDPPQAA